MSAFRPLGRMTRTALLDRWTKDVAASNLVEINFRTRRQDIRAKPPPITTSTDATRDGAIVSVPHLRHEWCGLHRLCIGHGFLAQESRSS